MCTFVLREAIEYYNHNRGTVLCTMLDATKAFDRIQYCKLFQKLLDRNLPVVVIRFLLNMYTAQQARVSWNSHFSPWFDIMNGVKQGGVLSPVLFCVYMDDLLTSRKCAGYGCYVGHVFFGALAYADDIMLLAPTQHAMRCMLKVCEEYANGFDKSKCIVCCPRYGPQYYTHHPAARFSISRNTIETVDNWLHLGHVISKDCNDRLDILSRRGSFDFQVNNIVCMFDKLDCVTKMKLFKAYCCSFTDVNSGIYLTLLFKPCV